MAAKVRGTRRASKKAAAYIKEVAARTNTVDADEIAEDPILAMDDLSDLKSDNTDFQPEPDAATAEDDSEATEDEDEDSSEDSRED